MCCSIRSAFVVFAATPTFATKAVPSVALVAFLGWRSPLRSTLIEMPHAAHPIVSVFFNFAFLPNDVNVDSVSSFTVFNLITDRAGASYALFDSFDCWTTPSSTKLSLRAEYTVVCFQGDCVCAMTRGVCSYVNSSCKAVMKIVMLPLIGNVSCASDVVQVSTSDVIAPRW